MSDSGSSHNVKYATDKELEKIEGLHNLRKSSIHHVATQAAILPCDEIIWWIIQHTDESTRKIYNDARKMIPTFILTGVEAYYKFPRVEVFSIDKWVRNFVREYISYLLISAMEEIFKWIDRIYMPLLTSNQLLCMLFDWSVNCMGKNIIHIWRNLRSQFCTPLQ